MASNKRINIIHMGVYRTMLNAEGAAILDGNICTLACTCYAAIALDDVQYKPIAKVTVTNLPLHYILTQLYKRHWWS